MDNLTEWLVPIVVFIIWAINAAIQLGKKKDADEGSSRRYTPLDHPANDDNERARRIQEEIRRKIAERRGESGQPRAESGPVYPREQADEPGPPPLHRPERMPSPLEAPRPMTSSREVAHRRQRFPQPAPSSEPAYGEARNYMAEFEARQREIEAAERKADAARKQARELVAQKLVTRRKRHHTAYVNSVAGSLRKDLRDPLALRKAVLHYEILGTPVGLRRDDQLYPHWKV